MREISYINNYKGVVTSAGMMDTAIDAVNPCEFIVGLGVVDAQNSIDAINDHRLVLIKMHHSGKYGKGYIVDDLFAKIDLNDYTHALWYSEDSKPSMFKFVIYSAVKDDE